MFGDLYIRNAGVGGLLILLVLVLLSGDQSSNSTNIRAVCWTPAQFTPSHIAYTNQVCSGSEAAGFYLPSPQQIPSDIVNKNTFHLAKKPAWMMPNTAWKNGAMRFIFSELILLILIFFLSSIILARFQIVGNSKNATKQKEENSSIEEEKLVRQDSTVTTRHGYCTVCLYVSLKFLLAFLFLCFALVCAFHSPFMASAWKDHHDYKASVNETIKPGTKFVVYQQLPDVYLCEFNIRHTTRIYSYVVQCTWESGENIAPKTSYQDVVHFGNIFLCVSIPFLMICQMVLMHCVYPNINKKGLEERGKQLGIQIQNDRNILYGLTDEYALLVLKT